MTEDGGPPASANQLATIATLCRMLKRPEHEEMAQWSKWQASEKITELSREYNEKHPGRRM